MILKRGAPVSIETEVMGSVLLLIPVVVCGAVGGSIGYVFVIERTYDES